MKEYIHGMVSVTRGRGGFCIPERFYPAQMAVLNRNPLWKVAARSDSGGYIGLLTDGGRVSIQYKPVDLGMILLSALRQVNPVNVKKLILGLRNYAHQPEEAKDPPEAIDLFVDGQPFGWVRPEWGRNEFTFANPERRQREVCLYFPLGMPGAYKDLRSDGSLAPLPEREKILCLGDSITQGFAAGRPGRSYVVRMAHLLGVEAWNQGVSGHVFQPESLDGLEALPFKPRFITVAYGTNDWDNVPDIELIRQNSLGYYDRLAALFPGVPIHAISPLWRADQDREAVSGVPLERIRDILQEAATRHAQVRVIDGFELIPHDPALFADGFLHPNSKGFTFMAQELAKRLV